jgi:hypothetical protein
LLSKSRKAVTTSYRIDEGALEVIEKDVPAKFSSIISPLMKYHMISENGER